MAYDPLHSHHSYLVDYPTRIRLRHSSWVSYSWLGVLSLQLCEFSPREPPLHPDILRNPFEGCADSERHHRRVAFDRHGIVTCSREDAARRGLGWNHKRHM
jgi:hypothetical protein